MRKGLLFPMNRLKIVLDHKPLPRSPTMVFSSVKEILPQHPVGILLENIIVNFIFLLMIFNFN